MKTSSLAVEPAEIFVHAQGFFHAQHTLIANVELPGTPQSLKLAIPALVLSAFASELFLKCLIAIETNTNPRNGHDLYALFEQLSPPTRQRITQMWDSYAARSKNNWDRLEKATGRKQVRDLQDALALGRRSFQAMRYIYEKPQFSFNLDNLPQMLERMVLELRPEWRATELRPEWPATHWA